MDEDSHDLSSTASTAPAATTCLPPQPPRVISAIARDERTIDAEAPGGTEAVVGADQPRRTSPRPRGSTREICRRPAGASSSPTTPTRPSARPSSRCSTTARLQAGAQSRPLLQGVRRPTAAPRQPSGYRPDETKQQFLARHGAGPGPGRPGAGAVLPADRRRPGGDPLPLPVPARRPVRRRPHPLRHARGVRPLRRERRGGRDDGPTTAGPASGVLRGPQPRRPGDPAQRRPPRRPAAQGAWRARLPEWSVGTVLAGRGDQGTAGGPPGRGRDARPCCSPPATAWASPTATRASSPTRGRSSARTGPARPAWRQTDSRRTSTWPPTTSLPMPSCTA